jgi:RNA polymerase sigma factor (sigma-70 family)
VRGFSHAGLKVFLAKFPSRFATQMRRSDSKLCRMDQPSDAELVRGALGATTAQQRTAAFEAIADRYRSVVLRQCASWYPDPDAAQDVGQAAFEAAFTLLAEGKGPERPDKLAGWLIEIARRRGQEYIRKTKPTGVQWAELREGEGLDDTEDDDESRSGSALRRAHATRLVETVVATLTDRQQQIYQLRFVQELTGRQIAGRLGIADKAASNEATIVQGLIADGFGALILLQEGRVYCRELARIIDSAASTHAAATPVLAAVPAQTDIFTAALRQRLVNHFNDCAVCDNCRTCNNKRRQLVGPYVPALIPILFGADFRDRIDEVIRRVVEHAHAGHKPPSHPDSGPPTAAAAAGGPPAMGGGLPVMAGAAAGPGAADVLVTRLQSLVHNASQSNRFPRWLRRAIPHNAGPGASITIVTAAVAAVVVTVAAIAVIATALTSSSATAGSVCSFVVDHTTSCESTNPEVQVYGFFNDNASRCTFVRDIDWGDGTKSDNVVIPGGPAGPKYEDSHTYSASGSYAIYFGGYVRGAGCSISIQTFHFKLLSK